MPKKPPRGFAALPPDARSELGRRGGQKSQASPSARRWTAQQAREIGKLGGRPKGKRGRFKPTAKYTTEPGA